MNVTKETIGLYVLDAKLTDLPALIIAGYVNDVSEEWIIIVRGKI